MRALVAAFLTAGLCVSASYVVPALAEYRPWIPGDPLPVLSALLPRESPRVVEAAGGGLVEADAPVEPSQPAPPVEVLAAVTAVVIAPLPERPPGVATAIEDPEDRGLDPWYRALHRVAAGAGMARAAHYGDSTIAADGITRTVRARLQARFGDGGPGYLSAGMDPRWSMRRDVTTSRNGTWDTVSLLLGGGAGRYSYGGIVATAEPEASLTIGAPKGTRMSRLELWYQGGAGRGGWWVAADGASVGQGSADAGGTEDRRHVVDVPGGYTRAAFGATGAPVPFYGVVMETAGPGVVWDALGVVGVGSRSFTQHSKRHLSAQVAQRDPDLIVVMLGGNELGLPVLGKKDGSNYIPYFQDTLRRIRAGAPDSACLIITPIDQGTRDDGEPRTKPNLARLVGAQRRAATTEGCAFWSAWQAMGGKDSIVRWSKMRPPLAWTDLNHLSSAGQDIVGDLLADALIHGYDGWVANGGPERPAPAPPGPPEAVEAAAPEAAEGPASPAVSPAGSPPATPEPPK